MPPFFVGTVLPIWTRGLVYKSFFFVTTTMMAMTIMTLTKTRCFVALVLVLVATDPRRWPIVESVYGYVHTLLVETTSLPVGP